MAKLGYRVVNVSERDLALGFDEFKKNVEGTGLKFVSANIVRQGTTERVFPPYEVLEVPTAKGKPLRVGIVGVTPVQPRVAEGGARGTNLGLAPPAEMLAAVLPEVRAKSDVVVLLAALNRDDAARLSRDVPGIDFVFGAYGGIDDTSFKKDGAPPVLYTGNQGRYTGEIRVFLDPARKVLDAQLYLHHLVARYPESPGMLAGWRPARRRTCRARKPGRVDGPGGPPPRARPGGATGRPRALRSDGGARRAARPVRRGAGAATSRRWRSSCASTGCRGGGRLAPLPFGRGGQRAKAAEAFAARLRTHLT